MDICSGPETCASSCAHTGTYGITAESDSLSLKLITKGSYTTNIGSRVYVMESDDTYKLYKLLNQEFTFDVDVSNLDCGLNGALYFVDMDTDGGMSRFSGNAAGAKYGTGYCDAQCPQDLKFISGEANVLNWTASAAILVLASTARAVLRWISGRRTASVTRIRRTRAL
ncbi:Exoglucanase 1 [Phytophthora capsici]|nr:Exoglucanase 1 [Phytophthora capsici]